MDDTPSLASVGRAILAEQRYAERQAKHMERLSAMRQRGAPRRNSWAEGLAKGRAAAVAKKWKPEQAIKSLRQWREEHGRWPLYEEYRLAGGRPGVDSVRRLFGTWKKALEAAERGY